MSSPACNTKYTTGDDSATSGPSDIGSYQQPNPNPYPNLHLITNPYHNFTPNP